MDYVGQGGGLLVATGINKEDRAEATWSLLNEVGQGMRCDRSMVAMGNRTGKRPTGHKG